MLDAVDRIQETSSARARPRAPSARTFMRGKDDARKVLRSKPVDMVQILNEIDGLETEIAKLLAIVNK